MTVDQKKFTDDYIKAWNSHDPNKILTFFTDNCIYEDLALGAVSHGKKELTAFINQVIYEFPDFKLELKSAFNAGDWVGSEWVMSGTFAKSANPALPATGKTFSVRGASIGQMKNGLISRNSDYWNMTAFLQQVGLMPASAKQA